jgi:hypothetical protein
MNKTVVIVYLVIFGTYILFTRTPDFFGSETTNATIHFAKDSTGVTAPFAFYSSGSANLKTDARYLFRSYRDGENCRVILHDDQPQVAAVYTFWGYWLTWQELISSIVLVVVLYQIARAITRNPTPEGLLSELEHNKPRPKKRRYN